MFRSGWISSKAVGTAASALLVAVVAACDDGGPVAPTGDPAFSASAGRSGDVPPGLQDRGPLERVQFIHYRRGFAKPPWAGGGGGGGGGSTCFAFIANEAAWNTAEPWEVSNGSDGVTESQLEARVAAAIGEWEAESGANIAGGGSSGNRTVDLNSTDGFNVVQFGGISSAGAIAITNVWGFFRGPPSTREIVEWDMILDDQDFAWSLDGAPGTMDVLNIVTHEIGHAFGMGHPENSCTEETMYAFADFEETKKRTLNDGDIAGINELY